MRLVFALEIIGALLFKVHANARIAAEYNLINTVLSKERYNKEVIPLVDDKTPVNVTFDMTFRRLIDVDEKNQAVTLQMWVRQEWQDPLLSWNPKDHRNITTINIPNDLIWLPDICLYNTVEDSAIMGERMDTSVKVDYYGNISWLSPYIFKSGCKIDVTLFPFDQQVCNLEFGSWTYTAGYLDIILKHELFDMSRYVKNTGWHVLGVTVERGLEDFPCCTKPYPMLTYQIIMKRRTLFSFTNLVVPPLIIVLLSFLTFWLPVECGERISLVMTVLLSMSVFLLHVSSFMPPTSEVVPLIGKFYLACMVVITTCLLATISTVKLHHTMKPVPNWIQLMVNRFLARMLLIGETPSLTKQGYRAITTTDNRRMVYNDRTFKNTGRNLDCEATPEVIAAQILRKQNIQFFVNSCRSDLNIMARRVHHQEADNIFCAQWKLAAQVLDRLFFILCFLLFFITVLVIFFGE